MTDYQEFAEMKAVIPAPALTETILSQVERDLNPPLIKTLSKVFLMHAVAGGITLLFCPQFGVNLGGGMGLMALFIRIGEPQCMLGCGAVFMGAGALASGLFLRKAELR